MRGSGGGGGGGGKQSIGDSFIFFVRDPRARGCTNLRKLNLVSYLYSFCSLPRGGGIQKRAARALADAIETMTTMSPTTAAAVTTQPSIEASAEATAPRRRGASGFQSPSLRGISDASSLSPRRDPMRPLNRGKESRTI